MNLFDTSYFQNPITNYFKWLFAKLAYQLKYFGKGIRIGYMSKVRNVVFEEYNWLSPFVILNNVRMGRYTYVSDNTVILEATLGRFCSIGPNVRIAPGKHPTHTIVSTHPAIYSNPSYCLRNFSTIDQHNPYRHVEIGNDVWICANAIIADGVKVGDGAIIAAGSVVTRDVEPYSIVSGIPAKHIRYRFSEAEVKVLLDSQWWNKDLDWIEKNAPYLWDIKKFMECKSL